MSRSGPKASLRITGELADKVFWYQLHVFQVCLLLFCTLPCLAIVIVLLPKLAPFMAAGPQRSSMTVLKVLVVLAPMVLVFVALACLACLFAAVLNVFFIRLFVPALRLPEARGILLQFYSDPRWLYQSRGTKSFPWWISPWGGMGSNKRLNRLCQRVTAWAIGVAYGAAA
ncbi:MAG: hypothetical protein WBR15_03770 [Gammaproteobacteria bacterium]